MIEPSKVPNGEQLLLAKMEGMTMEVKIYKTRPWDSTRTWDLQVIPGHRVSQGEGQPTFPLPLEGQGIELSTIAVTPHAR